MIKHSAIERDDGLKDKLGSKTGEPLCATKHWREGIPDAVNDIASSVGRDGFLEAKPASGLPRQIQF